MMLALNAFGLTNSTVPVDEYGTLPEILARFQRYMKVRGVQAACQRGGGPEKQA